MQYLAWLVPWTAAVSLRAALAFHFAAGAFLFAVYTYWSGRLPWYLADAIASGMWQGPTILLELATWATVVWMWRITRLRLQAPAAGRSALATSA
jgi:hypothetical protein